MGSNSSNSFFFFLPLFFIFFFPKNENDNIFVYFMWFRERDVRLSDFSEMVQFPINEMVFLREGKRV